MNVTAQKFQSLYALVGKSLAWSNHRTTLPQSRPAGVPAPSEREPGNVPIHRAGRKSQRCGRFSSPLRNSKVFYIPPFIGRHSLSLAFARQLPQRGSRKAFPFIVPVGNRNVGGRFSSPLRNVPFNRAVGKSGVGGRFSSPLRKRGLRGGTGGWRFGWWLRPGR